MVGEVERVDRLERLTDLVLVLLDTRRPLTLAEIAGSVVGYPEGEQACRQAFERDKRLLREEGIVVSVEPLPGQPGQVGYCIRPDDYYLPDLGLTEDEQAALNLALAGVHLDQGAGQGALLKLGGMERDGPAALAALPSLPQLPTVHQAIRDHAVLAFDYRGRRRVIDPWAVAFRRGWWYLVGHDREVAERRTYRVDRMSTVELAGPPGSATSPEAFDPGALLDEGPWRMGQEEAGVARVLVDAVLASDVEGYLGSEAVVERHPDGSVVVEMEVANVGAFRSFVLGLLDHATVLGPEPLRAAVVDWLAAMVGGWRAGATG